MVFLNHNSSPPPPCCHVPTLGRSEKSLGWTFFQSSQWVVQSWFWCFTADSLAASLRCPRLASFYWWDQGSDLIGELKATGQNGGPAEIYKASDQNALQVFQDIQEIFSPLMIYKMTHEPHEILLQKTSSHLPNLPYIHGWTKANFRARKYSFYRKIHLCIFG